MLPEQLLQAAVSASRPDMVTAWLDELEHHAVGASPDLIADAVRVSDRSDWARLRSQLGAGEMSVERALAVADHLMLDLNTNETLDEANQALLDLVKTSEIDHLDTEITISTEAWGLSATPWNGPARVVKHEVLRTLARKLAPAGLPWASLISQGYVEATSQPPSGDNFMKVVNWCQEDWSRLTEEDRQPIRDGLLSGGGIKPAAANCWIAALAHLDADFDFPYSDDQVLGLVTTPQPPWSGPPIRYWLRHHVESETVVIEFLERLNANAWDLSNYHFSLSEALTRLGPESASRILCHLVSLLLPLSDETAEFLFKAPLDQQALAHCIAEKLRATTGDPERTYLLQFWRSWSPNEPPARRELVEALRVMFEGSEEEFTVALDNLDLASNPPRGTKTSLVAAVQQRAADHDKADEAQDALLQHGLIRSRRSGLFGLRSTTEVTEESPEDG